MGLHAGGDLGADRPGREGDVRPARCRDGTRLAPRSARRCCRPCASSPTRAWRSTARVETHRLGAAASTTPASASTPRAACASPARSRACARRLNGKLWEELTAAEHRDFPGDYEAQVGQGPITLHSEENLVSSDRGLAHGAPPAPAQLDALAEGRDPIGVSFDPAAPPVSFEAGNFLIERRLHAP